MLFLAEAHRRLLSPAAVVLELLVVTAKEREKGWN
jgi:hypothetical protein